MQKTIHSLLRRQMRRHLGEGKPIPRELAGFIEAVNDAYHESDADRGMLERSLELSSQELLQANSGMRAIFQAIPDLFFRLDQDGTILECRGGNPADLFLQSANLVGKKIQDVPLKEVAVTFRAALEEVRRSRSMVSSEYCLEIEGTRSCYEARLLPLMQDQLIVFIRNITERKKNEEELLKMSKLDSLSVLAGGIAHDFNNILTAIIGNLSLAKENARSWDGAGALLSETERAALRAKKLVKQLLTFSRGGVTVRKLIRIGDLLRDSARFSLSGSNVSCEFAIGEDLHAVNVDEGQISQVVDNLVINAKQAMPRGGTVRIEAKNVTVHEGETTGGAPIPPGRYVRVTVEDRGLGIQSEHLPRIFDPYFTTKQSGSGLGLATTYSIVKMHEGFISVRSEVGVGSAFSFYLPASAELAVPGNGAVPPKKGGGTILVMDDEELVRTVTGRMLEHLGYSVKFARDGEEALAEYARARETGRPFDAVIMDVTIPAGMGGKEAIGRLRELDPSVRAIVSSGYSEDALTADFSAHGFCGALAKPYEIHELADAVREAIQGARAAGA